MAATSEEKKPRILFLGSGKVGKTSIIRRFIDNTFEEKYQPTVEDIYSRQFEVRGYLVDIEIMDTSGSYDFPAMRQIWIKSASAIVFVFAQNDTYSFLQVKSLLDQCIQERVNPSRLPVVVVCNKADLPVSDNNFSDGSIESWVADMDLKSTQFIYASAKTNASIVKIFEKLWIQNEELERIQFTPLTGAAGPDGSRRRLSAVAALSASTGGSGNTLRPPGSDSPQPVDKAATDAAANNGTGGPSALSKGLFRNRFGSQRKSQKTNKQKGKGGKSGPIKLDCVLS